MATKVLDIDLAGGLRDLTGLAPYTRAYVLLRWRGVPVGRCWMDINQGRINAHALWRVASWEFRETLIPLRVRELLPAAPRAAPPRPTCSVVVCTRNRTEDLRRCLDALRPAMAAGIEVIVVDNVPADDQSERLAKTYPVRYLRQLRSGVNWSRSLGAQAARGDIVAYTDDDAKVDAGWLDAILEPFSDPDVASVTGLVVPYELEAESQELFERHQSFVRGFARRNFTADVIPPAAAARAGAGANMAIRRELINNLRLFDEELDGGTVTLTGGDTYALYQLLRLGYRIVYQPSALVWHRHRLTPERLRRVVYGYSVGTFALLLHCLLRHRDVGAVAVGISWFVHHHLKQLWRGLRGKPGAQPVWLTLTELQGCAVGPWAYIASRWHARVLPPPVTLREAAVGEPA